MKVSELITELSHLDPNLEVRSITETDELFERVLQGLTEAGDKPSPPLQVREEFPGTLYDTRLKEGALVRAKTGGPLMVVEDVRSDGIVAVVWFTDGKCYRDAIHPDSLNVFVQVA